MNVDDEEAFTEFVHGEYPSALRAAYLVLGDSDLSRDVAQEAFTRLYARWRRVQGYDKPGAWVRRVVLREAVRTAKKRDRESSLGNVDSLPAREPRSDLALIAALRELPPRQRAAVVAFYLWDLPLAEVAGLMKAKEGTVKAHLHRARKRLALLLEEPDAR